MALEFEWDSEKAVKNFKKHGVPFEEAATVFADHSSIPYEDPDHSIGENRYLLMGISGYGRVLMVSYTEEREERIRVISAREATRRERRVYEEERFGA